MKVSFSLQSCSSCSDLWETPPTLWVSAPCRSPMFIGAAGPIRDSIISIDQIPGHQWCWGPREFFLLTQESFRVWFCWPTAPPCCSGHTSSFALLCNPQCNSIYFPWYSYSSLQDVFKQKDNTDVSLLHLISPLLVPSLFLSYRSCCLMLSPLILKNFPQHFVLSVSAQLLLVWNGLMTPSFWYEMDIFYWMQNLALAAWAVCFVFHHASNITLLSRDLCCLGGKSINTHISQYCPGCKACLTLLSVSPSLSCLVGWFGLVYLCVVCFVLVIWCWYAQVSSSLHLSNCGVSWVS